MISTTSDFIDRWDDVEMRDEGAYVSKQFTLFQEAFRREIINICENIGATLISFNKGHYDMSGFIERNDHYVYFCYDNSCNFGGRAFANLIRKGPFFCRTAAHGQDFRGGANNLVPFKDAEVAIDRLLNTEHRKV